MPNFIDFLQLKLATAATIVMAAAAAALSGILAVAAAAHEDKDKNDHPSTVIASEKTITHCCFPPFKAFTNILLRCGKKVTGIFRLNLK